MALFDCGHEEFYDKFDISPRFGFLTELRDSPDLPPEFDLFAEVVAHLDTEDGILFRKLVDDLGSFGYPQQFYIDLTLRQSREVQKTLYSIFTFIVQKYVRCLGKDYQLDTVPYEIGLVWYHTAQTFRLPTVTTYAALILSNWKFIDPLKPPSLDNVDAVRCCSGTDDERWFYRIHITIETVGARIVRQLHDVEQTTATVESAISFLIQLHAVVVEIRDILAQMRVGCDPEVYWNVVRIFLGGYTPENGLPNGLNIRDTDTKDIKFGGGSAAQSTLIQSLDVFLGVDHPTDKSKDFLRSQRAYMPERHVAYLDALGSHRTIRDIVLQYSDDLLTEQYNEVMSAFGRFRATHYGIVHAYVMRFTNLAKVRTESGDFKGAAEINKNNIYGNHGSGGTVLKMLDEYRGDTVRCRIKTAAGIASSITTTEDGEADSDGAGGSDAGASYGLEG
jgi:indoleamine 2,3-dioxygenase